MIPTACPACSAPLPPDARFCARCGRPASTMRAVAPSVTGGDPFTVVNQQPSDDHLPGGALLDGGRYRIVGMLNAGSFGAVYKAENSRLGGRHCAIKELRHNAQLTPREQAESETWFTREADLLMDLRHPMIPRIWDQFTEGTRHYLVMDLVVGRNLEEAMEAEGNRPLPEEVVLHWGLALCDVLAYLHGRQPPVVFRDLKPANIMITPEGALFLVDFGIARHLGALGLGGTLHAGTIIGTPGYAPLEQYQGHADPRSDIFALGATLHRLLTGYNPETGTPLTFPPPRRLRPDVRPATESLLAHALALNASDRFPTVQALAQAINTSLKLLSPAPAHPTGAGPSSQQTPVQPRQPRTIRVVQDGSGQATTINAALAQAALGDTIWIDKGSYDEHVTLDGPGPVALLGAGAAEVIVRGTDASQPVLTLRGGTRTEVAGLTFMTTARPPTGVAVPPAALVDVFQSSPVLHDCVISGGAGHGIAIHGSAARPVMRAVACTANGGNGISLTAGAGGTIESTTCTANAVTGISIVDAGTTPTVRANICRENRVSGITIAAGAGGTVEQNNCLSNGCGIDIHGAGTTPTVHGNICVQNTSCGIYVDAEAGGTLTENVCTGNVEDGIAVGSSGTEPTLQANQCERNQGSGINIFAGADGHITENVCMGNALYGISLQDHGTAPTVRGNRCERNQQCGIGVNGGAGGTVEGNTCTINARDGIGVAGSGTVSTLRGNRCERNQGAGIGVYDQSGGLVVGNTCTANTTYGITVEGEGTAPTVRANACEGNESGGIHVSQRASGLVAGNTCTSNQADGIDVEGMGTTPMLRGNRCERNQANGIAIWGGAGGTPGSGNTDDHHYFYGEGGVIEDNTCTANMGDGIFLRGAGTIQNVRSCMCRGNGHHGIHVAAAAAGTTEENTCTTNTGHGIYIEGAETMLVVRVNTCDDNGGSGICVGDGAGGVVEENTCVHNGTYGVDVVDAGRADLVLRTNTCKHNGKKDLNRRRF